MINEHAVEPLLNLFHTLVSDPKIVDVRALVLIAAGTDSQGDACVWLKAASQTGGDSERTRELVTSILKASLNNVEKYKEEALNNVETFKSEGSDI